jgi:hypothetical protein
MATPGLPATLVLRISNRGERDALASTTLTWAYPASLTIGSITPEPIRSDGLLTWTLPPQVAGQVIEIPIPYTLPANLPLGTELAVQANLAQLPGGDDREPNNNSAATTLRQAPRDPQVIVLTNMLRLAEIDPIYKLNEMRAALDTYISSVHGIEVSLDGDSYSIAFCRAVFNRAHNLVCLYSDFDQAAQVVAKELRRSPRDEAALKARVTDSLVARQRLIQAIASRIGDSVRQYSSLSTIYIIGGRWT